MFYEFKLNISVVWLSVTTLGNGFSPLTLFQLELDIKKQIPLSTLRILLLKFKQKYGKYSTGDVIFFEYLGNTNFVVCICSCQYYVEKFGSNVNRNPIKFFGMAGRSSEPCLVLPKLFSSYPIMDPSGCFATVRTRLGAWKIWCVRNNQVIDVDEKNLCCPCAPFDPVITIDLTNDDDEEEEEEDQVEEEDEEEDEEEEEEDEDTDGGENVDGSRMIVEIYNQFKFPPIVTFRPTMGKINIPNESNKSMPRLIFIISVVNDRFLLLLLQYIDKDIWNPHCLSKYKVAWLMTPMHGTRVWEVKLQVYKGKRLSKFCVDNNLKEGDNIDMHFVELKRQGMRVHVLHILVDLKVGN
ncbi:hypothetical protein ACJIZ3_014277 [Penstemon smallii]|uniref:TF-B3 domain-containing protein n=1 Tax=Penstemon smallii TaxID=265156 RepID=A0ABD3RJ29_9LAMI